MADGPADPAGAGALAVLDAPAVRRWLATALRELTVARDEIDGSNVYPVPDGDTGTNLVLTMESVVATVEPLARDASLADVLRAAARGALRGARGNSGVILGELLRAGGEALAAVEPAGADDLRTALAAGAAAARRAVAEPVEGTMLTVADAAAAGAVGDDLPTTVTAACAAAAAALRRTPEQLPALARAGVVDAGGRGLCVVLEALRAVVTGRPVPRPAPSPAARRAALVAAREAGDPAFGYEVQYLLDAPDAAIGPLREMLAALGDSLVVVGAEGLWNVHVHVADVGAAIEAGLDAGRPHRISVVRFADPPASHPVPAGQPAGAPAGPGRSAGSRAVVAVAPGAGLAELFAAAGAEVVPGGLNACPAAGGILDAIRRSGATEVVVLPNDPDVQAAADRAAAAAAAAGHAVHVIPTRSPVQGLAAVAVHDPARSFADDAIAMTRAASTTRHAEVTRAPRDAQTTAGPCRAGDVLGLVDGDVAVVGADESDVAVELVDRMLAAGGELVTIVTGADCAEAVGGRLAERIVARHPVVEVEVHRGGQPHHPLLLGVE